MKITAHKSSLNGAIAVPGSKSHTIRAVAVALLANGTSRIHAPLISEDTLSALNAAKELGATVVQEETCWTITGVAGNIKPKGKIIDLGNSGTSLRILTGISATTSHKITFTGDSSLQTRPMGTLLDALDSLGATITSNNGKCPLSVQGPITGGEITVDGTSSQFLTALLFATPLAKNDTIINVVNLNERPYVEITLDWLDYLGIKYEKNNDLSQFKVFGNQSYNAFERAIPADFSTATFPLVAAAVTQSRLKIMNLDFNDRQGDKATFDYLEKMGVTIERHDTYTEVVPNGKLKGVDLDLNATPDALPAIAIAMAVANGTSRLYNVAQARIKECDRIAAMTKELRKLGIEVEEHEDGMTITGGVFKGGSVEGYHDHRIVMAFTIAGFVSETPVTISTAEAAAVTYPNFIDDFKQLGGIIKND